MTIRITGMNSGLDTESIIAELVSAQSAKKNSLVKAQTKLSWKQAAWKTLNSKIYSFYQSSLSDMRFSDAYKQKKTTLSNSNIANVITSADSTDGVQTLKVNRLAKSGYMTGGKTATAAGDKVASTTTMTDMMGLAEGESANLQLKVGDTTKEISITGSSTVESVVNQLKSAGVNATFDAANQRFFISATSTGSDAEFSLTGADDNGIKALSSMGLLVDGQGDSEYANKVASLGIKFSDDTSFGNDGATRIAAQDAEIVLNNATFTSSTNNFSVNGLTITALAASSEEVTMTTGTDYDGIYDTVKDFVTKYNDIINEISTLYSADSAKGYEPLTSEEKDAMSDNEIEEWEKKIKDSLLSKDSTLSTLQENMTEVMQKGFSVNGQTMYLSSFGIGTGSYFDTTDQNRYALHIDGNKDDSYSANNEDKLRTAIANDPTTVASFFQALSNSLYTTLQDKMGVTALSSAMTFYNDKEMTEDYKDYTEQIETQEDKVTAMEDKWYGKFSAMETALAKLSSKSSAVSSLLG